MLYYIALVNNCSGYYLCTFLDTFFFLMYIYIYIYIYEQNSNHYADSRNSIFTKMTETWNNLPLTLRSIDY